MKLVTLALLVSTPLFASDPSLVRRSVIKIVSQIQGVQKELRGSGLMFQRDAKRYVLTSDHVVAHTNGLASHRGTSSVTGEELKLKFLASEWGNGLTLLEVEGPASENAVPYNELLAESSAQPGESAAFYGYPYESTDLTEETFGRLLHLTARMPYFLFARDLVEMEAAVGEFGMSGGAAFDAKGQFLGILAYQRILGEQTANRVYAIPRTIALPWIENYFKVTDKYLPYFSEPWFAQGDPRQQVLTNDGLLIMFRAFDNYYRLGIGRVEHLIVLSDGPSIRYEDPRGFMKIFRKFMADNPWRPSEYAIIDRSSGKPIARKIMFPAEVFLSFEEAAVSLFLVLGERHEERYARIKPLIDTLISQISELESKLKPLASVEVTALIQDLASLVVKLKAIPPVPSDTGAAGAAEFFSAEWSTDVVFQIEANAALIGWQEAERVAATASASVRAALKAFVDGLHVSEHKP